MMFLSEEIDDSMLSMPILVEEREEQQKQQQQVQNMFSGYGRNSSSSLPPPYPGSAAGQHKSSKSQSQRSQHLKQQSSMGSTSRSIFDSPEKAPRPEKPPPPQGPIHDLMPISFDPIIPSPPNYPHPHQPPPPPSDQSISLPHSYLKPGEPPIQHPQTLSPIRDNPKQLSLNTGHAPQSLDQGVIDTPTPKHIANMLFQGQNKPNYPNQKQTRSHKPPSSHSMKQSSSSSKLPPGHSKPQPHTKPVSPVQHKISSLPGQPGRSSSSSSKHNSSLDKIVAGGRGDGHHGRSQSHGGRHQQLIEDQLRQQERERQRHHREQYKHQQEHQQQQQQIAIALMQQVQSMYAGYDRSSSMGSKSRSILDSPEKATRTPPPLFPIHNSKPGSEGIDNSMLSMPILVGVREEQQQGQNIYARYDRSSSSSSLPPPYLGSTEGQHMSSKSQSQRSQLQKQQSSMGSMSKSIFDSPEGKSLIKFNPNPLLMRQYDTLLTAFIIFLYCFFLKIEDMLIGLGLIIINVFKCQFSYL